MGMPHGTLQMDPHERLCSSLLIFLLFMYQPLGEVVGHLGFSFALKHEVLHFQLISVL